MHVPISAPTPNPVGPTPRGVIIFRPMLLTGKYAPIHLALALASVTK